MLALTGTNVALFFLLGKGAVYLKHLVSKCACE